MKRIIYIAALLSLASCTSDDVVEQSDSNEIKFDVVTNNITRGAEFHNNNVAYQITDFLLWSVVSPTSTTTSLKTYIDKVKMTRESESIVFWSFSDNEVRYWPTTDYPLDFFGVHGLDKSTTTTTTTLGLESSKSKLTITGFTLPSAAESQDDLIYASATNQIRTTNSGTVALNFRHALSMINFNIALATPSHIYVEVSDISVSGVKNTGTLTIGNGVTTSPQYDSSVAYTYSDNCSWSDLSGSTTVSRTSEVDNSEFKYLCSANSGTSYADADALLVIPQVYITASYNLIENNLLEIKAGWNNQYLKVRCRIYHITDDTKFTEKYNSVTDKTSFTDVHEAVKDYCLPVLSTSADTWVDLCIPLPGDGKTYSTDEDGNIMYQQIYDENGDFKEYSTDPEIDSSKGTWEAGKKYVYTITFGTGETAAKDDSGNDTLCPISVTTSIDDWGNPYAEQTESITEK